MRIQRTRDGGFDIERAHHGHGLKPERAIPPAETPAEASPFAKMLAGLGRECDRGEKLVEKAVGSGKELGNVELLALQAGVYRYSEAVDLSAKLVDRASNGVKTVLQGQ